MDCQSKKASSSAIPVSVARSSRPASMRSKRGSRPSNFKKRPSAFCGRRGFPPRRASASVGLVRERMRRRSISTAKRCPRGRFRRLQDIIRQGRFSVRGNRPLPAELRARRGRNSGRKVCSGRRRPGRSLSERPEASEHCGKPCLTPGKCREAQALCGRGPPEGRALLPEIAEAVSSFFCNSVFFHIFSGCCRILCGGERHFSGLIRRQTPHFYAFSFREVFRKRYF